jgi:hypothetical protein
MKKESAAENLLEGRFKSLGHNQATSFKSDSQFSGTLPTGPGAGWSWGRDRGDRSLMPLKTLRFS